MTNKNFQRWNRLSLLASLGFNFTLVLSALPAKALTFTIGQNFTGSTYGIDSGFAPPDTMGAVGEDHIVELFNGRYSVYDKSSNTRVQTSTLDQFWTNTGVNFRGSYTFDPRVAYDPFSQRWFAVSADNAGFDNNFLVAVSNSSDPTTGWTGFAIDSDSSNQRQADFPTLGFNKDGIYLSANMFPISTSGASDNRTTIAVLPKADLLAATPSVADRTLFENVNPYTTGFTVQPIVDMDNSEQPEVLLSAFDTSIGYLKTSEIAGPVTTPTLDTGTGFPDEFISVTPFNSPPDAEQPGLKQNIKNNSSVFSSSVVLNNGDIWAVQSVENGDRSALRWFRIGAATNAVLETGLISDPTLSFYYGSIAVNDFGNVVIGFSGSSESQFVSSYAVVGETIDGATTFSSPLLLKAGVADYEVLDNNGRNRWGDYSSTVVDPTDPYSFWTFQEFASASNTWSTQITQLRIASGPEASSTPGVSAFGSLGVGSSASNTWSTQVTQSTIASVPETSSTLGVLAFGFLGVGSVLKNKLRKQKSASRDSNFV